MAFPEIPSATQIPNYCGPTALGAVLGYWGHPISQQHIGDSVFSRAIEGTVSLELMFYAMDHGFDAEIYSGSKADLKGLLLNGIPVIVSLRSKESRSRVHYIVVHGFDDRRRQWLVRGLGNAQKVSYRHFERQWSLSDHFTMVVHPESSESSE